MTNFLEDEARTINLRFAEAELVFNWYIKYLADTTNQQLRWVVEDNGVALQAMIVEILRRKPNQPQYSRSSEAASSCKTAPTPALASKLGVKTKCKYSTTNPDYRGKKKQLRKRQRAGFNNIQQAKARQWLIWPEYSSLRQCYQTGFPASQY